MKDLDSEQIKSIAIPAAGLTLIIIIILAVNAIGLGPYYQKQKIKRMEEAYREINLLVDEGMTTDLQGVLDEYSEKENISITIIDSTTSSGIISSERDNEFLIKKLRDRLFGQQSPDEQVLLENDSYAITKTDNGLEFFGYCSDNTTMVLMSVSVKGMAEAASQSNRYLTFAVIIAALLAFVTVILLSRKAEKVDQLERENKKLQEDLEEKERQDRIKQDFISGVSHELKTPIALIQGYAEGLSDGLCEDQESRKYYSDVIVDESQKMNRIVGQLTQLSSLELGADKPDMERFDISGMVKGLSDAIEILAEKKNAKIVCEIPEHLTAYGDEFKIEGAINNYLSNAINHVSDGGRIVVRLTDMGSKVRVSVFNTGDRIPDEEMERIWDKFYKIDKARTRAYGGSGIGLSLVKAVMNAHNQAYGADNKEDGVEFWLELDK